MIPGTLKNEVKFQRTFLFFFSTEAVKSAMVYYPLKIQKVPFKFKLIDYES